MSRKIGIVRLTYESLGQAIGLPEETRITAVVPQDAEAVGHGILGVVVEGPNAPPVHEGGTIPWVTVENLRGDMKLFQKADGTFRWHRAGYDPPEGEEWKEVMAVSKE